MPHVRGLRDTRVEPLKAGIYLVQCTEAQIDIAKTSGREMCVLKLRVLKGPVQRNREDPAGAPLVDCLVKPDITMKDRGTFARRKLKAAKKAFKVPTTRGVPLEKKLLGCTAWVKVARKKARDGIKLETITAYCLNQKGKRP